MPVILLAAAALFVALPFLTRKGVGTGEAYNYSLAVADGVTQLRAGVFPVLAGQTPFAFNGRVHPLRSAPYLVYLAGAIDGITAGRLGFSALQNLSLAFSLVASFFGAYAALRWGARCPPWPAAFLACVYGSGAALLAAAYSFNLFMTVHAAPFAPLVMAAVARQALGPSTRADFVLAAALAAAWWAHPPVALWLTVTAGALRILLWASQPSLRRLAGLAGAFGFGVLLAGFPFLSTFEITHYKSFFDYGTRGGVGYVGMVLSEGRQSLAGSMLPVSRVAGQLGDFQLGYVAWSLLAGVLVFVGLPGPWQGRRLAAAGLAAISVLLVALCVPVPLFTAWAWSRLPVVFYLLTNDWPMQRLYLVAAAAVILASGLVLAPQSEAAWRRRPIAMAGLLAIASAWMAWQAWPFVSRGFRDRWSAEVTARNFLPSNLDLTVSSYALVGVPPTFMHGVMEPWAEFRLLGRNGREPLAGNYASALTTAGLAEQGTFRSSPVPGPGGTPYRPELTLEPGRRYLLEFKWKTAPFPGVINLVGTSLQRFYQLPEAGEEQAFGMKPGQRAAVAISTSQATPEKVLLSVLTSDGNPRNAPPALLADFRLLAVNEPGLPVRVRSWLPLRAEVTAPSDDCYVETPRRFIPGYAATVNGRRVRPVASATGNVMIPVPAGTSRIEVRYDGTPLLRAAFWVSLGAWLAGAAAALGLLIVPATGVPAIHPPMRAGPPRSGRARSLLWAPACAAAFAAAAAIAWQHRQSRSAAPGTIGPLDVRLLLPKGLAARQQPIVVTGRPGTANFVYIAYPDDEHIRVGIDIWGYARLSEPLPVDYNQEQELVVSGGMLYPTGDPFMRALSPFMRDRLRRGLRVELNGRTVLLEGRPTYDSSPSTITIGRTIVGGSGLESRFSGAILEARRLPIPVSVVRSEKPLRLRLILPDNLEGMTEPLLEAGTGTGARKLFTIEYLEGSRIALGCEPAEGPEVRGAPQPAEPGRPHTVEFLSRGKDLALDFDRHQALLLPGRAFATGQVELDQLGVNPAGLGTARARFTGPVLESATLPRARPSPSAAPAGPIRILALLPADKMGVAEPLVATGRTGKGDVLYLKYIDTGHIQFGYDHWGVGGGISGPIAVDYSRLHELQVGLGSLHSGRTDAEWTALPPDARKRVLEQVTVRLDGIVVWEVSSPAYPTSQEDIQVGQNTIGASSCTAHFTGEILETGPGEP